MLNFAPVTLSALIHDIRLINAVFSPESGRFHPDAREHDADLTPAQRAAFRRRSPATVRLDNGATVEIAAARSDARAAAAAAIRTLRSGNAAASTATVTRHGYQSEHDLPGGAYRQQDAASARSDAPVVYADAADLNADPALNIDGVVFHSSPVDAKTQKPLPCPACGKLFCGLDQFGLDAETRALLDAATDGVE